jgi:histidinol-phosphatase (PHP family)
MRPTNYHTHSRFCDGVGEPAEYAEAAVSKGFAALGFSSHAPLPFESDWTMKPADLPRYAAEIRSLAERYRGTLEIYLGLEIDYIPGVMGPSDERFAKAGLEYTIGSVHMIRDDRSGRYLAIDGPVEEYEEIIRNVFAGDARAFAERYFALMSEMVTLHRPDIIGHLDVLMKNNIGRRFFSGTESWYLDAACGTLEAIRASGAVLEVNSGGLARKRTDFLYPSLPLLTVARELEIPAMLNADAHDPAHVDAFYDRGYALLAAAGYREVRVLLAGTWRDVPLENI